MKTNLINILETLRGNDVIIEYKGYDRITQKTEDTFDLFKPDGRKIIDKFRPAYNENELNINLTVRIPGTVQLNPNTAARVGLDEIQHVNRFKSFNIVKNGKIAENDFVVRANKAVFDKLVPTGVIKEYKRYKNLYAMKFDFTDIEIGKKTLTDEQLVEAVDTLNGLKIAEKAINGLFKKTAISTITEEQKLVLADYGIYGDVYTGIRNVTHDTNAEIELKKVVFKIKGETTIPSINAVLNKIPTRGVGLKLYEAYKRYEAFTPDQLKAEAKKIAAEIQAAKKLLAEERFAYTGENKTIEFNGKTLIIEVTDTTRAITQMA